MQRAEAAGYDALVLTVDAPASGARDRERRAGFRLPPGMTAVNLAGLAPPPTLPASTADDGLLTASEAAGLELSADWVILSACNTGYASGSAGDSMSTLLRGFFAGLRGG